MMSRLYSRLIVLPTTLLLMLLAAGGLPAQPPADGVWEANAALDKATTRTVEGLGAMQGVSFHDGKVYLYGDVWNAKPRVGVIREYTTDYQPTGRVVWLRRDDKPLLLHPTGLTWHERWGTFLGDTVNKKAVIYRFDWKHAWEDGNFDHAVLDIIDDDAAVNGCRPEFVTLEGKPYLATADYGDVHPEVRLYDPEKMLASKRTSAPGVVVHRILAGPFNQNLHWDADKGQLTCVQNVIAGRGWRLDILDLAKAVTDGRASGPGVRVRMLTFMPHDELEGYRPLEGGRGLFVTSSQKNNVVVGDVNVVAPRESRPEK
ncbi:MAG TPA: hypothetical protein VG122_09990 [Gemmata sp.]|nr:hypothetical protein [Gemmata sp.]